MYLPCLKFGRTETDRLVGRCTCSPSVKFRGSWLHQYVDSVVWLRFLWNILLPLLLDFRDGSVCLRGLKVGLGIGPSSAKTTTLLFRRSWNEFNASNELEEQWKLSITSSFCFKAEIISSKRNWVLPRINPKRYLCFWVHVSTLQLKKTRIKIEKSIPNLPKNI